MSGFRYLMAIVTGKMDGAASTSIPDSGLRVPLMIEWE
jgi:hypothetical protein